MVAPSRPNPTLTLTSTLTPTLTLTLTPTLTQVGGALTTFCAAIPLLFTQIIFFKEMVRE